MVITHTGYKPFVKTIVLNKTNNPYQLGWVTMTQQHSAQEEVVVTAIAPVRMKGDTLEFNPRAFTMDSTATSEDLMRRLPGFTIWDDGEITFNGKKIKALLVDGKPFLGGAKVAIATQNLPKNVLDKVQVYQQVDKNNPLDSTLLVNLKLKENKNRGVFAKTALGYGTNDRCQVEGMLTRFHPKWQLGIAAGANNVNKLVYNIQDLMANNTFKGESNGFQYQPDFSLQGLNRPVNGGFIFQYDFQKEYKKENRLNANYFLNSKNTTLLQNKTISTAIDTSRILKKRSSMADNNESTQQELEATWLKRNEVYSLKIGHNMLLQRTYATYKNEVLQTNAGDSITGSSITLESNQLLKSKHVTSIEYNVFENNSRLNIQKRKFLEGLYTHYSLTNHNEIGNGRNTTSFTALGNGTAGNSFDRLYAKKNASGITHSISVRYPLIAGSLMNKAGINGWQVNVEAKGAFHTNKHITAIRDLDTILKVYKSNEYLSNTRKENINDIISGLSISKYISKTLTNRYSKYIQIEVVPAFQFYAMQHTALQLSQNFNYFYRYFVPTALVRYSNHQFGNYEANYELRFQTQASYNTVQQIAPLIDSADIWYAPKGNTGIKPEYEKKGSFTYHFIRRKPRNPLQFNLSIEYTDKQRFITDSTLFDASGRRTVYNVNVQGYNRWSAAAELNKLYSFAKHHSIESRATGYVVKYRQPLNVNGKQQLSVNNIRSANVQSTYNYKDRFTFHTQFSVNFSSSIQNDNNGFNTNYQQVKLGISGKLYNSTVLNSHIIFNKNKLSNQPTERYAIWNASIAHRFLKGKQAEIKLAVLDILRQNRNVFANTSGNTQVFGFNNVLQQYFMASVAFYPRKFGKKQ